VKKLFQDECDHSRIIAGSSKGAVSSASSEVKSGWYQCQAAASKFRLYADIDLRTSEVLGIVQSGSVRTWTFYGLGISHDLRI
jgi:hypothetical protein